MSAQNTSRVFFMCISLSIALLAAGCCGITCTGEGNTFKKSPVVIVDEPAPEKTVESSAVKIEEDTAMLEESIAMVEEAPMEVTETPIGEPEFVDHVVKRGECLWWIAEYEDVYNDPFLWPLIYDTNKDKIKNPHLIYPGQVLKIPRSGFTKAQVDDARKAAGSTRPYVAPEGLTTN